MFFFYNTIKVTILINFCWVFLCIHSNNYHVVNPIDSARGYHAAFVVPRIVRDGKMYVLIGRESGGKDKGLYCFPGGSSGFWIFRDTDPLDTASREFCEETLTSWDHKTVYAHLFTQQNTIKIISSKGKKIVAFNAIFDTSAIDDIIFHFAQRRAATWFWQYYYREMDHFALVEWDTLVTATHKASSHGQVCTVEASIFDAKNINYEKRIITLRPIAVVISREYARDVSKM